MMDREDLETISSLTIKTDTGSKVLPGDKRGLPYEVWAIILSFLPVEDLCRSAMVCKTWYDLVLSLDHTKWQDLYLRCTGWRHPFWPLNLHAEPVSWRLAYKEQYIASYFWTKVNRDTSPVTCMSVFKRSRMRKIITVGIGKEHASLKSALAVANDYDRIMVYPGIYDEQFEMSSKIPFELVGCGELGSVILVVCIEQTAITGRISNLVFRAPWFTNFILKVRSGYLQVDNCIMEDGMVYVQNPGTIAVNFCTFRHATILLQHINASIIQNCEFSQTDSAAITVEGFPKDEKNWTNRSMVAKMMSTCSLHQRPERQKSGGTAPKSVFSTAFSISTATTNQKSAIKSCDTKKRTGSPAHLKGTQPCEIRQKCFDIDNGSHDLDARSCDERKHFKHKTDLGKVEGAVGGVEDIEYPGTSHDSHVTHNSHTGSDLTENDAAGSSTCSLQKKTKNKEKNNESVSLPHSSQSSADTKARKSNEKEKYRRIESFVSDCAKYNNPAAGENTLGEDDNDVHEPSADKESNKDSDDIAMSKVDDKGEEGKHKGADTSFESDNIDDDVKVPELDLHSLVSQNQENRGDNHDVPADKAAPEEDSLSSSEVSLHSASGSDLSDDGHGRGEYNSNSESTSSFSGDSLPLSDSEFSSSEESVIMLTYPDRHQPRSLSAQKEMAEVVSINSQNQSEHIDIIQDDEMKKILTEVKGCFIHKCRMTQSKGGVMVSLQAHAIILECEINSVGYGVRCIQNSRTVILKNEIHHCRTSGVFMRLAASGLVTGNDIHSNCEAGIDIRKNADPIVQCNRIHHGKRSGIVVLGSGRGQIKHNDIYQNKEAGVYILYRGNPTVSHNQIYSGRAAGIAVNEGGRGYILDNVITGNQWGGIDIRRGGDPVIFRNTLCNGVSDGVVIGEGGRGSIENNVITGNAGCGVWIMSAHQPLIHGNDIHSNRDSGISLVNRMDTSHKNETLVVDTKDIQSQRSLDFWSLINEDMSAPKQRLVTMATVEYNKIYHNDGKGISVQFGEGVIVQCNLVHANKADGIVIEQPFPAVVKDNCVTCNSGSGVITICQGKVDVRGNGIYDNRDSGIQCQSEADITYNDILGNKKGGIHIRSSDIVRVNNNRIEAASGSLVSVKQVKQCVVEDNVFYTEGDGEVEETESSCTIQRNQKHPVPATDSQPVSKKSMLQDQSKLGTTRWLLSNPTPHPHIDSPSQVTYTPNHHMTTITRVTVPAENCERGSRFCVIV